MMLISIGSAQLLPASLEQSPTHVGLYFGGVCCPLMQGHCQFLLLFSPSSVCPFWLAHPVAHWTAFQGQRPLFTHSLHLGCKFLGSCGNTPKPAAAPSASLMASPPSCQEGRSSSLRIRWWVMGTDIWWTTSPHSCFTERPGRVGLPSSQIRKHCVSTRLHIRK